MRGEKERLVEKSSLCCECMYVSVSKQVCVMSYVVDSLDCRSLLVYKLWGLLCGAASVICMCICMSYM